ncbi:hypothetical protein Zmor_010891 [Zophobas morio]|uniref:Uncharacterized protein n=1 Tax=Zophobas morio TaxID=2755281 RepID=A0AA38ITS0_9CUCU|nr:hypothetical protein Zmor_010891 [Zophobas morio]
MKYFVQVLFLIIIDGISFLVETKAGVVLQNDFAKLVRCDESFIKFTSFKFYKKSRTFAALNVTYTTFQDITSDEHVRLKVSAWQLRGNEFKKTVVDFSMGICTLYKANKFGALSLIKDSNLTGCPFPKDVYYINDMAPTSDVLPPFFPEGKWMLQLNFFNNGKVITEVQWMMTILKQL